MRIWRSDLHSWVKILFPTKKTSCVIKELPHTFMTKDLNFPQHDKTLSATSKSEGANRLILTESHRGVSQRRALTPASGVVPLPAVGRGVGTGRSPAGADRRVASRAASLSPTPAASPATLSLSFPDRQGSDASGAAPRASRCATETQHKAQKQPC